MYGQFETKTKTRIRKILVTLPNWLTLKICCAKDTVATTNWIRASTATIDELRMDMLQRYVRSSHTRSITETIPVNLQQIKKQTKYKKYDWQVSKKFFSNSLAVVLSISSPLSALIRYMWNRERLTVICCSLSEK